MNFEKIIPPNFNGVISIRKNSELIFQKAYGFADLANQIENKVDTKFETASAGKVFVATGILKLIEEKRLKFDDCIGDILKVDLKMIDPKITIEQLLTHTSGIPDYFDESEMDDYADLWKDFPNYKIRSSKDLIPLFINKPMMYPAGERFQYNNTGYVVLGLIIEELTGLPFDNYLEEEVFKPCNMKNTGYYELDRLPANTANSYIYDSKKKEYYTNIFSIDAKGSGAGGAFTTVIDINHFWDGLLKGNIISKEMVKKMVSTHSFDDDDYYGYGVWLKKEENFIPFFQGFDPGVSFISLYDLEKEINITIVSNFGDNVWKMNKDILELKDLL